MPTLQVKTRLSSATPSLRSSRNAMIVSKNLVFKMNAANLLYFTTLMAHFLKCTNTLAIFVKGEENVGVMRPNNTLPECELEPRIMELKNLLWEIKDGMKRLNHEMLHIKRTLKTLAPADMVYSSCLQVLEENSEAANGVYRIKTYTSSNFTHVYCHMTLLPGCFGGGWTMVMKLDGSKETFSYSSSYWVNMKSYCLENGRTGLDKRETKLPTYWSTSFNELCIGMKIGNALRFIQLNYTAASLYDILAYGVFHSTNIPRATWKSLYRSSSLQKYCGNQGFNVAGADPNHARVRIGIIGNEGDNCVYPDSFIGFGALGGRYRRYCGIMNITNSCGNSAYCSADNGNKEIRAMGYIFVR